MNGGAPSDACGGVGLIYYVQGLSGVMLSGSPKSGYELYALFDDGTAGSNACRTSTYGDPTVQYDKFADRWVFTEFAWISASGPYFQVNVVFSPLSDLT